MRYALVLLLVLTACGQAEKKDIDFGKGGGKQEACATPSFFRENFPGITELSQLPRGVYRLISIETFFREEGGDLRAHFMEGQRGSEFVSRKICVSALPARVLFSLPFVGLSEFSVADTMAYRPVTGTIFGEKESFSFSRTAPGAVVDGSISAVLSLWSHWVFYKMTDSEYELRLYTFESNDDRQVMKLMTLRFSFAPTIQ